MNIKFAVLAAIASGAMFAGVCQAKDYHWTFDKSNTLSPYPRDARSQIKLVKDAAAGPQALAIENIVGKGMTVYSFLEVPEQAGTVKISLYQKMIAENPADAKFNFTFYFNKKKGKQGSAGPKLVKVIEGAKDWKLENIEIPVPAAAAHIQMLISVSGKVAKTLFIDELKTKFVPNTPAEAAVPAGK